jgi:NAD(P)H-dependent FMN reductase
VPKLNVIICSTRPNRAGLPIGRWFFERAVRHAKFDAELVDLKEIDLPMLDEPNHPVKRQYQHDHTKAWSQKVESADAFVFVTPEYNYGSPPALVNALDYLFHEWNYKPAAFVSYGGISGGTRSVEMTKRVLTAVKVMPIPEAVHLPFFQKLMDEQGNFNAEPHHEQAAVKLLDELLRWSQALKTLRS